MSSQKIFWSSKNASFCTFWVQICNAAVSLKDPWKFNVRNVDFLEVFKDWERVNNWPILTQKVPKEELLNGQQLLEIFFNVDNIGRQRVVQYISIIFQLFE